MNSSGIEYRFPVLLRPSSSNRNQRIECSPQSICRSRWYILPVITTLLGPLNGINWPLVPIAENEKRVFSLRDTEDTIVA